MCRSQFIVWLTLKRQVVCRWLVCWWLERRRWFESPSTDFPTELPSWLHRRHDITLHHHHASCRIAFIKRTIAYTATQTCRSQRSMSSSVSQIFEVANFNGVFLEKISQKSLGRYCRFFRDASCAPPQSFAHHHLTICNTTCSEPARCVDHGTALFDACSVLSAQKRCCRVVTFTEPTTLIVT